MLLLDLMLSCALVSTVSTQSEYEVKEQIEKIVATDSSPVDTAIEPALYVIKTQIFNDGNKRTAIIFANHYLVAHGTGLMVVPENIVPEFKQLLVRYYEDIDADSIKDSLRNKCYRTFKTDTKK